MEDVLDEWLARIICFAFSIPHSALVSPVNRATAETAQDTALSEGLAPLHLWVKQLVKGVAERELKRSSDRAAKAACRFTGAPLGAPFVSRIIQIRERSS